MSATLGNAVTIFFFSLLSLWMILAWPTRWAAVPLIVLLFFPWWQLYLKRDLLPEWMQRQEK